MKKENIILSISVLVSNRIDTIRKCMESICPLLEQVPSELIVVDTIGEEKSDGSLAVAKEYATEVVHFDWRDDFAAARNAGLERASGEWFLFLDDDEWFENVEEIIQFFLSGEYHSYQSATYGIRNYQDMTGKKYSEAKLARMVRRRETLKFIGTIHESFSELSMPCKDLNSFVHHYGYAYKSEEEKKMHIERNQTLLEKELKKNPMDLRYRAQKAQELASYDNGEAMRFCKETFVLCAGKEKDNAFQWQLALVFRLHEALKTEFEEVEQEYKNLKETYGFNETTEVAVCFQMTRIALIKEMPERACEYVARYFEKYQWLKENPKKQQLQMCGDSGRYLIRPSYLEMLHFGAYCAWKAKDYENAWELFSELPWEDESYQNAEGMEFLWCLYQEAQQNDRMKKIVERLKKNKNVMRIKKFQNKIGRMEENIIRCMRGEETGPKWIQSDVKLTIGILVSNNIKTIRNCMESLVPILKNVQSELIVVDTVGEEDSDGSLAIAKEYTDKIYRFHWCNDFAAARNICFEHARGEWFLFVDDDEWFDDVTEIIEFFNSDECEQYGIGLYKIRNYTFAGNYSEAIVTRFIKRTETTRFVGKIHEQINEAYSPSKMFSAFAHHMGYAFRTDEEVKRHQERNLSLLRKAFEEEGYTPHICSQMIQELLYVPDTMEESYQFCLKSIDELEKSKALMDSNSQWTLVASARYFSMKEDYEGLLARVKRMEEKYPLSELAQIYLATIVTKAAESAKAYDVVKKAAEGYIRLYFWLKEHPEQALEQNQLDLGANFDKEVYHAILHIAAKCANESGDYELANGYWKRMPWDEEGFDKVRYWYDMQNTIEGLKQLQAQKKRQECMKECNVILESMEEAEAYLLTSLHQISKEDLLGLLSGMQEAAIAVGTKLDEELGEGTEEVTLLEKYCESVWKCSNAESTGEQRARLEEMSRLRGQVRGKLSPEE